MIIRWFARVWRWMLRLVVPPPVGYKVPQKPFDLKAKCPACGHGPMTVECVTVTTNPMRQGAIRKARMMFQCTVCKAVIFTDPLMGTDADKLWGREISGL